MNGIAHITSLPGTMQDDAQVSPDELNVPGVALGNVTFTVLFSFVYCNMLLHSVASGWISALLPVTVISSH